MRTTEISNNQDIIDSRDVIRRIRELEDERDSYEPTELDDEAEEIELTDERKLELWAEDNEDEAKELKALTALEEDCNSREWRHGVALIRESHFSKYCQELCADLGDVPRELPSYLVIDWEATADNLRADYQETDFNGVTYLYRD